MFCPKCSQQQADGSRFCSRCGFPLAGVNDLLARGGQAPVWAGPPEGSAPAGPRPMSPRRKGVKQGGGLIMIGIFLIPFMAILHEVIGLGPEELPLIGVLVFLAGLLRMLYAAFFEEGAPRRAHELPQTYAPPVAHTLGPARYDALPPAQGTPVYEYRPPQVHTAEMQPPPSVTDHTTRLLERESDTEREDR